MASTTSTQSLILGDIAVARGVLGPAHAHATVDQIEKTAHLLRDPASYSNELENCIICVDDRPGPDGSRKRAPRLAGGALSLGLMYHLLYGGATLSSCLNELKRLGFYLVLHNDCGALMLAPSLIPERLSDSGAEGYKVMEALGLRTDTAIRKRIAHWAGSLPQEFFDIDACLELVNEVERVVGEKNAIAVAVSIKDGESFVAASELSEQTSGSRAFAFDPWAANHAALRIGVALDESRAAEQLGQIFTAEVLLQLAASDLNIIVHE